MSAPPGRGDRSILLSIATLGMALFGPIALFTGMWAFATLWQGAPRPLLAVFVSSLAATGFFTLLYASVHAASGRRPDRSEDR